jgi:hypothetical protein
VSEPIRSECDISSRRLVRNSRVGSLEVDRSLMAPSCEGSLLVAIGVGRVIHVRLKGSNVPTERVLSPSKNAILCSLFSTSISGAFAKLRKETASFVMCVCPSVHVGKLGFYWTDFHEI